MASEISSTRVLENNIHKVEQAKAKLLEEEQRLIKDKSKLERNGEVELTKTRERVKDDLEIQSKRGEQEIELSKKLNQQNVRTINENSQRQMVELSAKTAKDLENARNFADLELHKLRAKNAEVFLETAKKAEDPFYRPKQFTTTIDEKENSFVVKIALPPHEARDVSIAGHTNQLRLSFSRSYSADTEIDPKTKNITRSSESVTEIHELPALMDLKKLTKNYADGILTIQIPKLNPLTMNSKKVAERMAEIENSTTMPATKPTSGTSS